MIRISSFDPEKTARVAGALAETLKPGDVIALIGDLGAGKTVFSKGIARGLGVKEHVTSPTFIIMQQYEDGRLPLYHFDVYRTDDPDELYEIGADEFFYGEGVCVVEWADMIEEMLPNNTIRVRITKDSKEEPDRRRIEISGLEKDTEDRLKESIRQNESETDEPL